MAPRNRIVWVPSDSEDDPVEYSDDSTGDEHAPQVPPRTPPDNPRPSQTTSSSSSVPPSVPPQASTASSSSSTSTATPPNDTLHTLLEQLSLRSPNDRTIYSVSGTNGTGVRLTADWEEAGYLKNTPGVRVQAIQTRRKPKGKALAYVVFVGRQPGVYTTWDECEASTSGFSGAILQGYRTIRDAHAAFELALSKGWTRHAEGITLPFPNPTNVDALEAVRKGAISDRWYVVTIGTIPGVYRCFLQCAILTVGVPRGVHNSYDDEMTARRAFERATNLGHVQAVTLP